ncbi:MAG: HAD family hydrolase [Planctomycetota bacterium]
MVETKTKITDVLIDVDGTITGTKMDLRKDTSSCLEILVKEVMEKHRLDKDSSLELISSKGSPETECIFNITDRLDIQKSDYWNKLQKNIAEVTEVEPDAAFFIKFLLENNIPLYSATTNSRMMTLLKLSIGGLADIDGSKYFKGYFGGDTFGDPKGKFSDKFYTDIIKTGNFDSESILMVGDDPQWDLEMALKAGINNIVIVDRTMPSDIEYKNEGIYVNSLAQVPELFEF